jgi:predicted  nucleic acid-binding Zn-ribbon protein
LLEDSPRTAALRQKQRFLKGLLMWDLRRDYSARVWAEKKSLRDLDRQIKEAQRRHHQVETARSEWPEQFAQLTSSIEGLAPRVAGLRATAGSALDRQQAFLQGLAVDELQAQRARLNTYMVQARFALAAIYDRAAATAGVTPDSLVAEGGR